MQLQQCGRVQMESKLEIYPRRHRQRKIQTHIRQQIQRRPDALIPMQLAISTCLFLDKDELVLKMHLACHVERGATPASQFCFCGWLDARSSNNFIPCLLGFCWPTSLDFFNDWMIWMIWMCFRSRVHTLQAAQGQANRLLLIHSRLQAQRHQTWISQRARRSHRRSSSSGWLSVFFTCRCKHAEQCLRISGF